MIKYLLPFLFLVPSVAAAGDERSLELITGGITYHVIDGGASSLYSNKISDDGRLIVTPMIGLRLRSSPDLSYTSLAVFHGTNSIGSPINGATFSYGFAFYHFDLGLIAGGYIQNNEDYKAKYIIPYSLTDGTNALVPIFGIEVNFRIPLGEHTFLGINNLISPIITNHNLSFGINL